MRIQVNQSHSAKLPESVERELDPILRSLDHGDEHPLTREMLSDLKRQVLAARAPDEGSNEDRFGFSRKLAINGNGRQLIDCILEGLQRRLDSPIETDEEIFLSGAGE